MKYISYQAYDYISKFYVGIKYKTMNKIIDKYRKSVKHNVKVNNYYMDI